MTGAFDLHMHTRYCDGADTCESMVCSAIEKGLSAVGLSGHSYTFFDESYCMSEADTLRYLNEINSLKEKYRDRITVLCGIEQDYFSAYPTDAFDYVIGSVHYLKCDGDYVPVDESPEILKDAAARYFGDDLYALCEAYFETVADVVKKTGCDIIGHFDLISKFNETGTKKNSGAPLFDANHPRYAAAWRKALDRLLSDAEKTGAVFEINTGAISRGYRTAPYPADDMIHYIKQRGGRLILSSDAHRAQDIAFGFERGFNA